MGGGEGMTNEVEKEKGGAVGKETENTVKHFLLSFLAPMDTAQKEYCGPH